MTLSDKLTAIKEAISGRDPRGVAALRESELRFRQVTESIREVFFLVMPGATRESTTVWAERMLEKVREMRVVADGVALPQLSVSIGVALFPEHGEETAKVIGAADDALYAAKDAGRDRYAISAEVPPPAAEDEPGSIP